MKQWSGVESGLAHAAIVSRLITAGDKKILQHIVPVVSRFLAKELPERSDKYPLPDFATELHPWLAKTREQMDIESPRRNEGIVTQTAVNFVGAGAPFYEPGENVPGSSIVIGQYIEFNNFMLQIRERRGAYGAFVTADHWTGMLIFMSYRDPNLQETLEVYTSVPSYLKEQMQNSEAAAPLINSAIIGTIGSLDGSAPQPNTAGWLSLRQWLMGSTPKLRQKWRDEILATGSDDFVEFEKRLENQWKPLVAVAGPKSVLGKEKDLALTLIDVSE